MNQLFEYGSAVDIVLRAKNQITIGGKTYQKGEVYTMFKNVRTRFNYAPTNASMSATKPVYNGTVYSLPQSVSTSTLPLTTKLADLMFTSVSSTQKLQEIEQRTANSEGEIILRANVAEGLFVYGSGDKLVENYSFDAATRTLSGLTPSAFYTIYYLSCVESGAVFGLEQEMRPYFEAELIGQGNTSKRTSKVHLLLPAVKIDMEPSFVFVDDGQLGVSLSLNIIYKGQAQPVVVFR